MKLFPGINHGFREKNCQPVAAGQNFTFVIDVCIMAQENFSEELIYNDQGSVKKLVRILVIMLTAVFNQADRGRKNC